MAQNKTAYTNESVTEFLNQVENKQKHADSLCLIDLMEQVTNEKPKMWGSSIIGFGNYSYQYASGHSGEAPVLGFSPRKAAISLYVYSGSLGQEDLLKDLGKFTMGKSCIYIKKLSDIDEDVLLSLMQSTLSFLTTTYRRL
jgi:hypothetical protein